MLNTCTFHIIGISAPCHLCKGVSKSPLGGSQGAFIRQFGSKILNCLFLLTACLNAFNKLLWRFRLITYKRFFFLSALGNKKSKATMRLVSKLLSSGKLEWSANTSIPDPRNGNAIVLKALNQYRRANIG